MDEVAIVWMAAIVTTMMLMAASFGFVQIHIKPSETTIFTKGVACFAMFTAFSAIFILPIDIFFVMQPLVGSQGDIRSLYYSIYLVLAVLVFFLIPFAYFLYEEDDGHNHLLPQAIRAAKYSLGISGVVITLAVVVLCANYQKLASQSGPDRTQSAISTLIGIMLVVGLLGYMTYTAYGLAELPSYFFRRIAPIWRHSESDDHRNELLSINSEIETLQARHLLRPENVWPQKDQLEIARLRDRQSQLALMCDQPTPSQRSSGVSWIGAVFRKLTGFCLACLSFLIILSLVLSIIDKLMNSECGFRCGFQSNQLLANPLSLLLLASSNYFPLDLVIFSILMFYLFTCTLIGLSHLGVRILFVKLYSIRLGKTEPNALLMGIWFMMFFLLAINLQTLVLVPHYATFGNQLITDLDGSVRSCSLSDIGNGCIPSVLWQMNNSLFSNIPLIGGLTFIANIILALVFLSTLIWVTCAHKKPYIREIDEADDLGEYLIS